MVVINKTMKEVIILSFKFISQIEIVFLVPPVAVLLCKTPLVQKYDLSSLKIIVSGSAPLGKETEEELCRTLNHTVRVSQGSFIKANNYQS